MIISRVKRLIFTYAIVGIALFTFSACEENTEIFDNLEIKKETDDDKSNVEKPKINGPDGN